MSFTKVHAINNQQLMLVATANATLAEIMAEKSTIEIRRDAATRRAKLSHRAVMHKTVDAYAGLEDTLFEGKRRDFVATQRARKQQRNAERSTKRKLKDLP